MFNYIILKKLSYFVIDNNVDNINLSLNLNNCKKYKLNKPAAIIAPETIKTVIIPLESTGTVTVSKFKFNKFI